MLSQSNVRRIKAGVSIEELAEDIARRTFSRAYRAADRRRHGAETGMFEVPAGGRRFRALELLVKQKRLAATPRSLRRAHRATSRRRQPGRERSTRPAASARPVLRFPALREKGKSEEEIAAAFFVSAGVVRQRLRLAAVSPELLEAYAEEAMTLDQLMGFTVNSDHARQEQVWEALQRAYTREL